MHIQDIMPANQSASKEYHSCELSPFYIHKEALNYVERGKVMNLCAVDLSTAVDILNNKILPQVLQNKYGVGGSVYSWCKS